MKLAVGLLNSAHVKALRQPLWERSLTPAQQALATQRAEALGYWKVGVPEHFLIPEHHIELSGEHYPQTTTALGWLAGVTSTIRLASNITILPLQHPVVHAKMWGTLDWLSGGRAIMMVGVGWLKDEFDVLGLPFHERGRVCDEYVEAILELWKPGVATYEGRYVNFRDVACAPRPVQAGGVPIWFGGDADGVLKRIARWGAGWSPFQTPPDEIPAKLDWIRARPDYHGRPIGVDYSLSHLRLGHGHVVRDDDARGEGLSDAQQLIDQIGYLQGLGVTETRVSAPPLADFEAYLDWLAWVAEVVAPKVA